MEKGTTGAEAATRSSMQMGTAGGAYDEDQLESNASIIRIVETFLRLFPVGLCVTALVIMLKNSQENQYGSVAYSDLGALRYQSIKCTKLIQILFFFSFNYRIRKALAQR